MQSIDKTLPETDAVIFAPGNQIRRLTAKQFRPALPGVLALLFTADFNLTPIK
jgi:hypothetical protein